MNLTDNKRPPQKKETTKQKIRKEIRRINRYINAQRSKYGDNLLVPFEVNPEVEIAKYKTDKEKLKHLKKMTAKTLKMKIRVVVPSTGEVKTLSETQTQTRSEAQIKSRKSRQAFWGGEEEPHEETGEEYYPTKEEIEYNNLGEALATMAGETWNYQEFSLANYKALNKFIEDELTMHGKNRYGDAYAGEHHERGALVQHWLANMVEKFGLAQVASMINQFAGENSFNREAIFYKVGYNTEFIYRAMNYLPMDDAERKELYAYLERDFEDYENMK